MIKYWSNMDIHMEGMTMKNKSGILSILFFLFVTLFVASNLYALTISNASIQYIDCSGFCFEPGLTSTYNRDNTGSGQESNGIIVTDGHGNILVSDGGSSPVPGSYTTQAPWCYTYDTPPLYNPITIQLISPAGNGYGKQIAYQTTGICQGLQFLSSSIPTMNQWGMIIFVVLAGIGAVYYLRRQRRVRS
jgi:hypothetical protein